MARQVRIDDDLATWLEDRYPTHSLSAAACAALIEYRERQVPVSTARGEVTHATGPVVLDRSADPADRADAIRAREARPGRCPHPLERRVGIRCGDCGEPVHPGPRPSR